MRLRTFLPALALGVTLSGCNLLGGLMGGGGGTPPETLTVKNGSGETLFYLYARPSGTNSWSDDLLEGDAYTMSDGETGSIKLPSSRSCLYDFRGTALSAEKEYVASKFNVCRNGTLTIGTMR